MEPRPAEPRFDLARGWWIAAGVVSLVAGVGSLGARPPGRSAFVVMLLLPLLSRAGTIGQRAIAYDTARPVAAVRGVELGSPQAEAGDPAARP